LIRINEYFINNFSLQEFDYQQRNRSVDAAYATCEENLKGMLKPNMLADVVVLKQNP